MIVHRGALILLACLAWIGSALADEDADDHWTAVTLARTGAWGVSRAPTRGSAIAGAIRDCRAKAPAFSDCGSQYTATRANWSIGLMCRHGYVLVAAPSLEAALLNARDHARADHALFSCKIALAVSPAGQIVLPRESALSIWR